MAMQSARPDKIVAQANILVNLIFNGDGTHLNITPTNTANLYCPFIPDEVLVHQIHAVDTVTGAAIVCMVFSDLFGFQNEGFIGVGKDRLVREPMRFILHRNSFPPINGRYNFMMTAMDGLSPALGANNARVLIQLECIRYETPGFPRE